MPDNKYLTYTLALLAVSFWGASYIWTKVVFNTYNPITTIFLRLTLSSVILFVLLWILKKDEKVSKKDYLSFLAMSFFSPFCYFLSEGFGLKLVSPTVASVIIATIPIFAPFLGYLVFREKITPLNVLGFIVSFAGVALMVFDFESGFRASPLGVMLLFMAVLSALIYVAFLKKLALKYSPLTIVKVQNLLGALFFLPLFVLFDFTNFISVRPTADALWAIVKLAVFASTLAFIFHTYAVQKIGIARTSIFSNLIPVFTAFFAFMLLNENLELHKIIGIVVVITGLVLTQVSRFKYFTKQK